MLLFSHQMLLLNDIYVASPTQNQPTNENLPESLISKPVAQFPTNREISPQKRNRILTCRAPLGETLRKEHREGYKTWSPENPPSPTPQKQYTLTQRLDFSIESHHSHLKFYSECSTLAHNPLQAEVESRKSNHHATTS